MTTNFLPPFFFSPFFYLSLLSAIAAAIASGMIGSYLVVKRMVFVGGSISHAVLGGIGIALYVKAIYAIDWLQPIHGALAAAILTAGVIGVIHLYSRQREDTTIAALWAFGMSIGVIFISLTPGYTPELLDYLFGNILWTSRSDIYLLIGLDLVLLVVVILFHNRFVAICFDEDQAKLQGQKVVFLYFLLLSLTGITVVLLIQVVGAILLLAILALPAAIANAWTQNLVKMMVLSFFFTVIASFFGLSLSWIFNWPPGATIALALSCFYMIHSLYSKSTS